MHNLISSSQELCVVGSIVPILWMRKLRLTNVECYINKEYVNKTLRNGLQMLKVEDRERKWMRKRFKV